MADSYAQLFTALIAFTGALVGGCLTSWFNFRNQIKTVMFQKRQQSYGEIMGHKFLLMQLYVSRFEALIFSDYHERRWHLGGNSPNSLDLSEAQRWMHKSEDLALEVAKTNQSLFESIGIAKASFRHDDVLDTLTQRIYHFRTPTVAGPPATENTQELDAWKATAVAQLQQLVAEEYGKPLDALLDYLHLHISDHIL